MLSHEKGPRRMCLKCGSWPTPEPLSSCRHTCKQAADAAIENVAQCAPTPDRLIVLGDSIAACAGVGGKNGATCGPKIFHEGLASGYAPGIVYQNTAVSGAVTTNVADSQLGSVATGAGHALVLIYVGGNEFTSAITKRFSVEPFEAERPSVEAP